jgi:hypothetical protein
VGGVGSEAQCFELPLSLPNAGWHKRQTSAAERFTTSSQKTAINSENLRVSCADGDSHRFPWDKSLTVNRSTTLGIELRILLGRRRSCGRTTCLQQSEDTHRVHDDSIIAAITRTVVGDYAPHEGEIDVHTMGGNAFGGVLVCCAGAIPRSQRR